MKKVAAVIAAAIVAISAAQPVLAQDFRHGGYHGPRGGDHHRPPLARHHDHRDRNSDRDAAIAGGIGLATGLLIGGLVVDHPPSPRPRFERFPPPPPPRWDRDRPHHQRFARPWTPGWYRWCSTTYRSFNPRSGMFVGWDGRRRFCIAG